MTLANHEKKGGPNENIGSWDRHKNLCRSKKCLYLTVTIIKYYWSKYFTFLIFTYFSSATFIIMYNTIEFFLVIVVLCWLLLVIVSFRVLLENTADSTKFSDMFYCKYPYSISYRPFLYGVSNIDSSQSDTYSSQILFLSWGNLW